MPSEYLRLTVHQCCCDMSRSVVCHCVTDNLDDVYRLMVHFVNHRALAQSRQGTNFLEMAQASK